VWLGELGKTKIIFVGQKDYNKGVKKKGTKNPAGEEGQRKIIKQQLGEERRSVGVEVEESREPFQPFKKGFVRKKLN